MSNKQSNESIIAEDPILLYAMGLSSEGVNDDQQALCYYTQALEQIKSTDDTNGDIYQLKYDIYLNICDIYMRQYNATLANTFVDQALQIAYKLHQQDKIAKCLDHRGNIKTIQGDCDGALLDHNKSVEIKMEIDNHEGLDVSNSFANIGDVYYKQGKYDAAICMYEKSLKIQLSVKGDPNPRVTVTYNNMGLVYENQGKFDDAIYMYEKSLQMKLLAFDDNHPNLVPTYSNIGNVYLHQGKYDDAIFMYEKSVNIMKCSATGQQHPMIAIIYNNMGSVYSHQEKYDDAILMYQKSLEINLLGLGEHHPEIATTYINIGLVYYHQGKYDDAISMYEKSLQINLLALGDNHPSVAQTYHNIGAVYDDQGKYDGAISMYEKSLQIQLSALGDNNHPSIADTYHNMASVYYRRGKNDDAISMYKKSLQIRLSVLGDHHPRTAITYFNLGKVYDHQGKYDDAIIMYEKSLKIELLAHGDNHPNIATTYNSIGDIYCIQNMHDDALFMYEKALKIELSAFGNDHPSIATTYSNIADIYRHQDKYDEAILYYKSAANILVDARLQNHPNLARIYDNIARCHDAIAMQQRSDEFYRSLHQDDIIESTSTSDISQSQASQDDQLSQNDLISYLSDQQISNSSASASDGNNDGDSHSDSNSDSDDHSHRSSSHDQVLKEKQYFKAYVQALQQGSCKNKVIRAIYAGPQCVGKSSIMRVFTQQQLINLQLTQIADQSDKMVRLQVYRIKDRTTHHLYQIWDDSVHQIVQDNYENRINNQQITKLTPGLIDKSFKHLSIDDQYPSTTIQSTTVNQHSTLPPHTPTISSIDNTSFLQQCRNLFQHYYPSWFNTTIDDSQYAKIWDFGGHSIYHVTHQPFLSGNSMYFLVFNINQSSHDKVIARDGQLLNITYLQSMQEWLTSIIGGNANHNKMTATIDNDEVQYSLPIVILVASHGDHMTNKQQGINRFIEFERELITTMPRYKSNIYSSRIIFNCNPDDNSDATLLEREQCSLRLHEIMKSFVQSLPFMCHPVPIRWYIMATILHTPIDSSNNEAVSSFINGIRSTRVHKIMTIQEIQLLAQDFGLYEDNEELIAMLSYLHDLGEIIFAHQANKYGIIITDVDWLLHIFRAIIQLHDCTSGSLEIQSLYEEASRTGKISAKYINHVLAPYKLDNQMNQSIINLMETYDILCTIKSDNDQDQCSYFVPYLLRPDVQPFDLSQYHVSEILYIGYEFDDIPYIPDGIYYCLLSSCLKEWNNSKIELYYQCAKFYLTSSRHYIIIKKDNSHIALQYCYQKLDNIVFANSIESTVQASIYENRPHDVIKQKLSLLINNRMPKFEGSTIRYYVRCNECNQLTFIDDNNQSPDKYLTQCQNQNCNKLFESQSVNDWMYRNEESELEHELSNDPRKYFYKVAKGVGVAWTELAAKLNISHVDVEVIAAENQHIFDRAITALNKWYGMEGNGAITARLLQALHDIGKTNVVDDIQNE